MLHVINSAVKKEIETYHSFRIYLFKVNSKNITASSNLFKVWWRCSGFLIVNFEHISCHILVILLLTLKRWITAGTVITSQLKVQSCKMRNYWKIIAYVYEMYPESFSVRCVISFITYLWRNIYTLFEFEFNHIAAKQVLTTVQGTYDGCSSMLNKYWQKCKQPMIGVLRNKRS